MNNKPSEPTNFRLPSPVSENQQPASQGESGQIPAQTQGVNASSAAPSSLTAHDIDLIEAEWVRKVEQIMREGVNDPNALSQQLSYLKEQYLVTRYGKSIKHKKKDM